jgi:hypothetical protein
MTRHAELVATSRADDLSLRALADVAHITAEDNARVVGGQMTALLLTAFPVAGVDPRRTRDADAAVTTELAGAGLLHDRLIELGYSATSGNSYSKAVPELAAPDTLAPEQSVDLLVPSLDGRFHSSEHGGRAFDAAPGLALALAAPPIVIDVGATLLDGTLIEFTARVPTVEVALIIKALTYASRQQDRDVEDIYRLLEIADSYADDEIGAWRLSDADLIGSRRDSAAALHALVRDRLRLKRVEVPAARLAILTAALVTRS